jgi:hypothetical protein
MGVEGMAALDEEVHNWDAGTLEDALSEFLIHGGGATEDAGADVGKVSEFEEALHGAVFAEGAVDDGEDNVDVGIGTGFWKDRLGLPLPFPVDKVAMGAVSSGVEVGDDRFSGTEAHFVFAGPTAVNYCNVEFGHAAFPFYCEGLLRGLGEGAEIFDLGLVAIGSGEAGIEGKEGEVEGFGQDDVSGVVGGDVFVELPDVGEHGDHRVGDDPEGEEVVKGPVGLPMFEDALGFELTNTVGDFDVEELGDDEVLALVDAIEERDAVFGTGEDFDQDRGVKDGRGAFC